MKMSGAFCRVMALAAVCGCAAGAQQPAPVDANGGMQTNDRVDVLPQGLEVLSDTKGVDFKPYLNGILKQIYGGWVKLMPAEARPPQVMQGVTDIRFTINPDGTVAAIHLEKSAEDEALNRAARGSITGVGQFPPLPKEFHGPELVLRIHYLYNIQPK